jgi:hypothetical protein
MNTLLNCALQLNNEGVTLMTTNQDQEALQSLSRSLQLVKQVLYPFQEQEEQETFYGSTDSIATTRAAILHNDTYALENLGDNSQSFVYNNAVTFSLESDKDGDCPPPRGEKNLHVCIATIIFNITLVYHRQGKIGKPACIVKAIRMYERVIELIGSSLDIQGTALLIQLAAINNLSQIRQEQGDLKSSQEGFHLLAWRIGTTTTNEQGSHSFTGVVKPEQVEGMLLNILFSSSAYLSSAAA